jgi:hypothetical protein
MVGRDIGLEVNADKSKYLVVSRDQNAGRNHSIKLDNSSFEMVEQFKYMETTLTQQNYIQEEIKSRLKSVQNLLSSSLLSKQKFKDYDIQNYNFACFVWV